MVLIGLVVIGAVVGGVFWMGNRDAQENRDEQLIAAPEGDYKVKPDDPGGMQVEGQGGTAFAASDGADPKGAIDTSAVPETPITEVKPAPKAAPATTPNQPAPKAAPQPAPKQAAAPSGPGIQLGAFSSQAGANSAWKALSGRFTYLAPLTHSVTPTSSGGRTLYRLRASGPGAANVCGRLRAAGESCVSVD
jgi:cell division septation protein DedD